MTWDELQELLLVKEAERIVTFAYWEDQKKKIRDDYALPLPELDE